MANLTETFMQALQQTEQSGDPSGLVELFADGSTLQNLTTRTWEGKEGAGQFWQTYLDNFASIRSEFSQNADTGSYGVMEWTGKGELKNGQPIEYRGVSIIEHDGQQVSAFRTYYDSAAFLAPEAKS